MQKFMKFTMFEKETKDKKYRKNPYNQQTLNMMKIII